MNARARPAAVQPMKTPPRPHGGDARKWDKPKTDTSQRTAATATTTTTMKPSPRKPVQSPAAAASNRRNRKERKLALQQDVDRLKKRLRHEENVHRALERAFTRPLGALPRLPPYLPPQMLELLAEVAVLEEEVVRLEEQVVNCRQGLYQEAIYISSSKKVVAEPAALQLSPCSATNSTGNSKESSQSGSSEASVSSSEPQFSPPSKMRLDRGSDGTKITRIGVVGRSPVKKNDSWGKDSNFNHQDGGAKSTIKLQLQLQSPQKKVTKTSKPITEMPNLQKQPKEAIVAHESSPNRISEDLLGCLVTIFSSINTPQNMETELEMAPSISGANGDSKLTTSQDPYHICLQFGERDVGPYMQFLSVDINSIDLSLTSNYPCLLRKLKLFLRKLETVDLRGLNHQQKLAFWINIYNSCMMNAFREHGIPATPHMIVALMQKAMINVGGHLLSAMTIEHFILRLPYNFKSALPKSSKNDEVGTRSILGLDWPEPLVTFALSCGSWSSPAVRVYSAANVETELQSAKCDYLQAAVGISPTKMFAIPKLLDWYLLDFAKDAESLVDWICLQLPAELRKEAIKCIEQARRAQCTSPIMQILPYDFKFRYLLAI